MHYLRAYLTGGNALLQYIYYERTCITESHVLKMKVCIRSSELWLSSWSHKSAIFVTFYAAI